MEKRKIGFVSIGGLNDLVIQDLQVTLQDRRRRGLPEDAGRAIVDTVVDSVGEEVSFEGVMKELGLPKVSRVRIEGLKIFSLTDRTNAVLRVFAREAVSNSGGFELHECDIIQKDVFSFAEVAKLLFVGSTVKVTWPEGSMTF